ncbi:MAG: cya 3, partial [Planctomycetaceae bacterium]|nr:cya 3 [Planctomycetaceae bacterium]
AGAPDEVGQTLTVTATVTGGTNLNLINNLITSSVSGTGTATLKYIPTPNEFGTAIVTVMVSDNGANGGPNGDINFTTQTFTITVTPVNDAPTLTALPDQSSNEDAGPQLIGLTGISVGPANEAPSQTLSFTVTSDNPALIPNNPNNLSITYNQGDSTGQLSYTAVPNGFGVANITVTMKDSGLTANGGSDTVVRTFKITVNQVPDAPTNILLSANNVFENRPAGTPVGTLSTTDVDLPDDNFTYSIVSGSGQSAFQIVGNQLQTAQSLDFETNPSYTVTIRTTDRFGLTFDKTFTLFVLNVNDAPTLDVINPVNFNEDPANPVAINLTGISAGAGEGAQNVTISATSDNSSLFNSPLSINYTSPGATGTLFLTPNLNANGSATITIVVQDNGGTANGGINTITRTFTVTVNPVNDNPTDISLSNNTIPEIAAGTLLPAHVLVGTLSSTDPDNPAAGDTFNYSLVSGSGSTDNTRFSIFNNQLFAEGPIDFDTQPDYTVRIRSTDSGTPNLSFDKVFTIHSTNVNEPATGIGTSPNLNSGVPNSIPENQPGGSVVGTLVAADPDSGDTSTFSLVSGVGSNDNARFSIVNGQLIANTTFDFEAKSSYTVRLRAVDALGLAFETAVTINITNVDEAPVDLNLSNNVVPEDIAVGASVGTLSSQDPDQADTFTYSLVAGPGAADNTRFSISGNQLTIAAPLNYEERPSHSYSIRLRSTDSGGLTFDKVVTINVTDVNEAPTDLTLSPTSINENLPAGTVVGTLTPVDQDLNDTYTFAFVNTGSNDNGSFELNGNKLVAAVSFDFETKASYTVVVQGTDGAGHQIVRPFTITIINQKDGPVVTLASSTLNTTGHKAVVVDPAATLTDVDSTNFDGGKLVVSIESGEQTGDTLGFKNEPRIKGGLTLKTAHGKTVLLLGKQQIGTISGGVHGVPLTIQFGTGITQDIFQRVIREITFRGKPFAAPRQISMQAFDETHLGSNIAIRNINVN